MQKLTGKSKDADRTVFAPWSSSCLCWETFSAVLLHGNISNIRRETPRQDWMAKSVKEDYWEQQTQTLTGTEQAFKNNINVAKDRFNQTGEASGENIKIFVLKNILINCFNSSSITRPALAHIDKQDLGSHL
ncbi:hypothetical protein QQF64_034340 [Cirrhinus molitorella]|uniref:MHC class I-like antigen recognition-like domain-containing protein n=1 Tax=Cirrhinus molitorella TaxID=172907 RepID=A0ABR3L4P0_9TELE